MKTKKATKTKAKSRIIFFFVLKIRSTPMRATVLIVPFLVMAMSIVSSVSCRRLLPLLTFIATAIEMIYFGIVDNSSGKDTLLTKIYVLAVSIFIIAALILSYNFVCKPEAPYLANGGATLWTRKRKNLLTKFVQIVIPMPRGCRKSTIGSFETVNTIMITTASSNTSMFLET